MSKAITNKTSTISFRVKEESKIKLRKKLIALGYSNTTCYSEWINEQIRGFLNG